MRVSHPVALFVFTCNLNSSYDGDTLPHTRLQNPNTGGYSFGRVPDAKSRDVVFPGGHIYLPTGKHIGPNKGFGACHIWAEHKKEMLVAKFDAEDLVPHYVATIIQGGTPLLFEGQYAKALRLIAVRGVSGMAILELRERPEEIFWSVITAYSANKKHGVRIGTVLDVV